MKPKSADELANEYASRNNVSWATKEWNHDVKTFLAGHASREPEIAALREALKVYANLNTRTELAQAVLTKYPAPSEGE